MHRIGFVHNRLLSPSIRNLLQNQSNLLASIESIVFLTIFLSTLDNVSSFFHFAFSFLFPLFSFPLSTALTRFVCGVCCLLRPTAISTTSQVLPVLKILSCQPACHLKTHQRFLKSFVGFFLVFFAVVSVDVVAFISVAKSVWFFLSLLAFVYLCNFCSVCTLAAQGNLISNLLLKHLFSFVRFVASILSSRFCGYDFFFVFHFAIFKTEKPFALSRMILFSQVWRCFLHPAFSALSAKFESSHSLSLSLSLFWFSLTTRTVLSQ